ncbi:MAG TPA: metallophosphoesterase family protein [Phycisphaerae bacterium]|nr:metallophosphoesterase family protein [Phycisphaerae bacterium]
MRILILSDIHANIWALQAVEKDAGPVDYVLCAGDCVTYGTRPGETVQWLQSHRAIVVRGNHDHAAAFNQHPHAAPQKAHLALTLRDWTRSKLHDAQLSWLSRLPLELTWEINGVRFVLVHATPVDPLYDYRITPKASDDLLEEAGMMTVCGEVLVVGHTHLPYQRRFWQIKMVNPGSIGQPLDNDPRAAYAIWDNGQITLRRTAYPQTELIRSLDELSLSEDLYVSLRKSFELGRLF